MKQRPLIWWLVVPPSALAVLVVGGFIAFWFAVSTGSDSGSPALAAEWRDHLAQFNGPDAARAADPAVVVVRCKNGDWAFGRSQDSHGIWRRGGGTVVIRDSGGRTRAFFGHVCGGGHLGIGPAEPLSLADFYEQLVKSGFTEHPLK
jgi:hypothetical protein